MFASCAQTEKSLLRLKMRCIFIIGSVLILCLFNQSNGFEHQNSYKIDCFFIGNNLSSVHYVFGVANSNETQDNCSDIEDNETMAQNVKFVKISGLTIVSKISQKNVANLIKKVIENFKKIRALDVSNNSLELADSLQFDFEYLVFLNASQNKLTRITGDSFSGALKLIEIDLSFNEISSLREDLFSKLAELEFIDLRSNKIDKIGQSFDHNWKLKRVNFQDNPIIYIDCDIFKLLNRSVSVDVSWDIVEHLDLKCMDIIMKIKVKNDAIQIEVPNSGQVISIQKSDFRKFKYVHFGPNHLTNAMETLEFLGPSIELLSLCQNFVGKLNRNSFPKFAELTRLSLDFTNLTEFDGNPFENMPKLISLTISYNQLKRLNVELLSSTLMRLKNFNIAGNRIENIQEILHHLCNENLLMLDISSNQLTELDLSIPEPFHSLETFSVNGNQLTKLHGLIPINYPRLKYLDIGGNHFSCEYISNFKQNWTNLEIYGDPCNQQNQTSNYYIYIVPMGMLVIIIISIVVIWIVRRRISKQNDAQVQMIRPHTKENGAYEKEDRVSDHIYEEIPERPMSEYARLNYHPEPSTSIQTHYSNAASNRNALEQAPETQKQPIPAYDTLDFIPNSTSIQMHYQNAFTAANQQEEINVRANTPN